MGTLILALVAIMVLLGLLVTWAMFAVAILMLRILAALVILPLQALASARVERRE